MLVKWKYIKKDKKKHKIQKGPSQGVITDKRILCGGGMPT